MVNTRLIEADMPILAYPPGIMESDETVLRDALGTPAREPCCADAMRAAARDLAQRREYCGKRNSLNDGYPNNAHDNPGNPMSEHFDRFCRFPG